MKNNNFFIITGGPGAGKTTLINELKKLGYNCIPDMAREVIKEELQKKNSDILPWKNKAKFQERVLYRQLESYKEVDPKKITFFDGAPLDLIAYIQRAGLEVSPELQVEAEKATFNNKVFILPPWREIYHTDTERKQSYQESVDVYNAIYKTYKNYGYELIEVPKTNLQDRVKFIFNQI